MLKKGEKHDILYLELRWDIMNNNLLIGTAMLNAFWEINKKDTFDLLVPFVKYSIAKTTKQGEKIDTKRMVEYLKQMFGYDTIPSYAVSVILKRLSPRILAKEKSNYRLKVSLDSETEKFDKKYLECREQQQKVAQSLMAFLNENLNLNQNYDEESALSVLIKFFVNNGLLIQTNVNVLEAYKLKDDKLNYLIAQFVLQEAKSESVVFDYIKEMVKGFFLSLAISFQKQNNSIVQEKLSGLSCYFDTRVIINALGMNLPDEKSCALEMLNMLREKGAKLFCFRHTLGEIYDITEAYKRSLLNPKSKTNPMTLVGWDELHYSIADVDRYQSVLEQKISALGIEVVETPSIKNVEHFPVDEVALNDYIDERILYYNKEAIETDVRSIISILLLREDSHVSELEKCKYIFVTSNGKLSRVSNNYLLENKICSDREVPPFITDMDLSSIVWLKCYATHKDYPKQKLIACSISALEPSLSVMQTFFGMVDRMKSEGDISEDEAAIIRTSLFCRKQLAQIAAGDASVIKEETVYQIRDSMRDDLIGKSNQQAQINLKMYEQKNAEERQKKNNAIQEAKLLYERTEKRMIHIFKAIEVGLLAVSFVAVFWLFICSADFSRGFFVAVGLLLLNIVGIVDSIMPKMKWMNKITHNWARRIAAEKKDKKIEEYERILGPLMS